MKKSEPNFIPSRSNSAGLKLILKVGTSSASECMNANDTLSEGDQMSLQRMSPQKYGDDFKRHKKYKKKKRKKEKHEKKKRHHKEKHKHSDVQDESFNYYGSPKKTAVSLDNFSDSLSSVRIAGSSNAVADNNALISEKDRTTSTQKLLDYVQDNIENKDGQNFFKWPVTDQIAPGYSLVIAQPMDLNTMKLKINRGMYNSLADYMGDFRLMCKNAMVYNHPDTVYYKSAKKLLHYGLKFTDPARLRSLEPVMTFMNEITDVELGFPASNSSTEQSMSTDAVIKTENDADSDSTVAPPVANNDKELSAADVLAQIQEASKRIHGDRKKPKMGFLRQTDDGYTSLSILVPNEGINKETRERPVLLGSLIGKSGHGISSWQPFKEDKRNTVKPVKPLNYGSFGSYAPSYDSTFANLTKEETGLLYRTYGDESAVQYAESLLDFAKDSDYTTVMVDSLLDIMTSGEHRKTKKILDEKKKAKEQEDEKNEENKRKSPSVAPVSSGSVDSYPVADSTMANASAVTEVASSVPSATTIPSTVSSTNASCVVTTTTTTSTTSARDTSVTSTSPAASSTAPGLDCLKTLSDLGIDTSFVDYFEELLKEEQIMKNKLMHTKALLEKLHQAQTDRLSNPPTSFSTIAVPSELETQLADKVTENLKNVIKKVPPSVVAPMNSIRKALGVSVNTSDGNGATTDFYNNNKQVAASSDGNTKASGRNGEENAVVTNAETTTRASNNNAAVVGVTASTSLFHAPGIDLESELREFLESDTELSHFELSDDDKTIEQMLSESS